MRINKQINWQINKITISLYNKTSRIVKMNKWIWNVVGILKLYEKTNDNISINILFLLSYLSEMNEIHTHTFPHQQLDGHVCLCMKLIASFVLHISRLENALQPRRERSARINRNRTLVRPKVRGARNRECLWDEVVLRAIHSPKQLVY